MEIIRITVSFICLHKISFTGSIKRSILPAPTINTSPHISGGNHVQKLFPSYTAVLRDRHLIKMIRELTPESVLTSRIDIQQDQLIQ